ncbi:cupin [Streptomyces sp. Ru71]|uniref:cupin domain-containing protein n=1 Tax=Streptomyces sp. Ru71 TaxID=2080746 RepID=UPI000CDE21B8|nr:cupin domain-containing protein [Streptomyces sp. Ru71]POX43142.1 cupin [Streptomyces sp. Ru71]
MTTLTPIDLFTAAVHVGPDGGVTAGERRMTEGRPGSWQLAAFHAASDTDVHADHWEMHPEADELVCVLSGRIRFHLHPDTPGTPEQTATLTPGTAIVVPRGRWHRMQIDEGPVQLLSLSPREGTQLKPVS